MVAHVVQVKYEVLEETAQRFSASGESCEGLQQIVQAHLRELQNGGWHGRGSAAFFAEMEEEILPAMGRLISALNAASAATRQIGDVMRQAEEEAARPFVGEAETVVTTETILASNGAGAAPLAAGLFGFGTGTPAAGSSASAASQAQRKVKAGFPQAARKLHKATPEAIRAVQDMIQEAEAIHGREGASEAFKNKLRDAAIAAADAYGVDRTNVRSISFDPDMAKEGNTNSSRGVRLGAAAYVAADNTYSVPELAATVLHESTHADQYVAHDAHGRSADVLTKNATAPSKQLEWTDEIEAYSVVLNNADTLGLSQGQRIDYQERIETYKKRLLPDARALVDKGNFEAARRRIDPGQRR